MGCSNVIVALVVAKEILLLNCFVVLENFLCNSSSRNVILAVDMPFGLRFLCDRIVNVAVAKKNVLVDTVIPV